MNIEGALYYYGLRANLPFNVLRAVAEACDTMRQPSDVWRRSKAARQLRNSSRWHGFLPREKGYAFFDRDKIPGIESVVAACRRLVDERRNNAPKRREKNPFAFFERPEDFEQHPELLQFALSGPVVETVSDYLGVLPQLHSIGLWVTEPLHDPHFSSQLFHLDQPEVGIIGVFVNISDVSLENGPLTLIPADISERINEAVNYPKRYYCADGRVTDAEIFQICAPKDVKSLVGPAGTGVFVDLSACQHYGSRCVGGERIMFAVKFQKAHKARHGMRQTFGRFKDKFKGHRSLVLT
ncbi:MAG TPA: hypothetical protein VFA57_08670 [Pseudolabrys sp.]|nr:hypothetical protein [Pseudolabrys sp.]